MYGRKLKLVMFAKAVWLTGQASSWKFMNYKKMNPWNKLFSSKSGCKLLKIYNPEATNQVKTSSVLKVIHVPGRSKITVQFRNTERVLIV